MTKKVLLLCLLFTTSLAAQYAPDYSGGYKISFDSTKYLRILSWAQVQGNYKMNPAKNTEAFSYNLRRARFLMFGQINKDFMILTHFGLNSHNAGNMDPVGKGGSAQLFLHEAVVEYNVMDLFQIGAGLHYQNGINRVNSQSTLNMLGMDNNRSSWSTIGLTDQFARHLGTYIKGKIGQFDYRLSVNDALKTTLDDGKKTGYVGAKTNSEKAGKVYSGYADYQFLDQESNKLPYEVGSYLGAKTIFNIGAGFLSHPAGVVSKDGGFEDVLLWSVDMFYDAPLGADGSAITAYAQFQSNDYGSYQLGSTYGTGSMIYAQLGYLLPGKMEDFRFQPYVTFLNNAFDKDNLTKKEYKAGVNWFIGGHNCKVTAEYANTDFNNKTAETISVQAMIVL